jgi:hypothetical protein
MRNFNVANVPMYEWVRISDKDDKQIERVYRNPKQTQMARERREQAAKVREAEAEAVASGISAVTTTEVTQGGVFKGVRDIKPDGTVEEMGRREFARRERGAGGFDPDPPSLEELEALVADFKPVSLTKK